MKHSIPFFILILVLTSIGPDVAQAQRTGDNYGSSDEEDDERQLPRRVPPRVSKEKTDGVAEALRQAARFCEAIPQKIYIIDCFASELMTISKELPPSGDYADAREALEQASNDLEALVKANLDTTQPSIKVKSSGRRPKTSERRSRAIKASSLPRVASQATAVLERTQTVLLRSTANSDHRRSHYQRIARSLETGTVMLRSL